MNNIDTKFKKGNKGYWKDKKRSKEDRLKMSIARKGIKPWNYGLKGVMPRPWNKNLTISDPRIKRIVEKRLKEGKYKQTEETKIKISNSVRNNPTRYWLGKKRLDITREKCHLWTGGLSFEPYTTDWNNTLRRSIRERDHYTCKLCGLLQSETAFCVHHIDYDKKNCNPENLITLCKKCHTKTNFNRNKWTEYFRNVK